VKSTKTTTTRPAHGVTGWLKTIPHRTPLQLVRYVDPDVDGKADRHGNPLPPRLECQNRAQRRAYGRAHQVPTPAPAFQPYMGGDAA